MNKNKNSIFDALQYNITSRFEELYGKNNITKDVINQVISPEFECVMDGELFAPKARGNKIIIQANYISFLWGFIYGAWVQFEESIIKNKLIQQGQQNSVVINRAEKILYDTLNNKSYTCPEGYPSPNLTSPIKDENFYASKVNGIFVDALCILLFHEVCHIKSKHYEKWDTFDDETKIQCEKDCDAYALKAVIADFAKIKDSEYKGKSISILCAFTTMIFLLKNPLFIMQKKHPDLALRVANAISQINIQKKDHLFYIYSFADTLLRYFRENHKKIYDFMGVNFENKIVETAKDLFDNDLEKIKIPVIHLYCIGLNTEYSSKEIYGFLSNDDISEDEKDILNFITINEIKPSNHDDFLESFLYAKNAFFEVIRNDSMYFNDDLYHYTVKTVSKDFVPKALKEKIPNPD
ncbi:MAG: hypothetical protein J6P84_00095 [Alphaproteobacteria bacterium]|nr:hypothetical protein [Alphaproteobacteria bacterium]MBO7551615.1 hypothetical protein [Fibrobacter sp.]